MQKKPGNISLKITPDTSTIVLKQGTQRLIEMRQTWSEKENKVVSQGSMDEGEIELF